MQASAGFCVGAQLSFGRVLLLKLTSAVSCFLPSSFDTNSDGIYLKDWFPVIAGQNLKPSSTDVRKLRLLKVRLVYSSHIS